MINHEDWNLRFEAEAFGKVKDLLETRFRESKVPDNIIGEIINRYKSHPQMIRDRVHAAASLFELLAPKWAGGFTEQDAYILERALRLPMMKLTDARAEY